MNTVESILEKLEEMAEERGHLDPLTWLEGAVKLSVLIQSRADEMAEIEFTLAKMKAAYLEDGQTAAYAKAMIEADDLYLRYLKLSALIKRVDDIKLIAKKFASVSSDMMRSNL